MFFLTFRRPTFIVMSAFFQKLDTNTLQPEVDRQPTFFSFSPSSCCLTADLVLEKGAELAPCSF